MKNLIKTSRFALLIITIALFTANVANATPTIANNKSVATIDQSLLYDCSGTSNVGITPNEKAKGATYEILNERGTVVYRGTISSTRTFYISTYKLGSGVSTLFINGVVVRQFVVD